MSERSLYLPDEHATHNFGCQLAALLHSGLIVYLRGTLGAGKTSLCRSIVRAVCDYSGPVKSPTYTLVEPYVYTERTEGEQAERTVYHFDLYRLADPEELEFIGARDYFGPHSLCLIEWPDKGLGVIPPADLVLELAPEMDGRRIKITAFSDAGKGINEKLVASL